MDTANVRTAWTATSATVTLATTSTHRGTSARVRDRTTESFRFHEVIVLLSSSHWWLRNIHRRGHVVKDLFMFPYSLVVQDKNECETEPCGHGRGLCVNMEGSYKCLCRQGYKHMVQHGRLKCIGKLSEFEALSFWQPSDTSLVLCFLFHRCERVLQARHLWRRWQVCEPARLLQMWMSQRLQDQATPFSSLWRYQDTDCSDGGH